MGGLCENCSKLRVIKMFLVLCLTLVALQYLINLVTVNYVSKIIRGSSSYTSNSSLLGFFFPSLDDDDDDDVVSDVGNNYSNTAWLARLQVPPRNGTASSNGTNLCPLVPPSLVGALATYKEVLSFDELHKKYPELQAGGRFKPPLCTARHRVAIVVPYRDREAQLKTLLNNLHPILERQQLDYAIYIVEQAPPSTFNRALLMNIGYAEAIKDYDFQCFIFHDVDLIPENDRNLYTCPENPRHMSVAIDKFNYKLPYAALFGGVSALSREHMVKVNGFSNLYFGWGGEDDDMMKRIKHNKLKLSRAPIEHARYKMIKHGRDKTNTVNKKRFKLLYSAEKRMKTDGLNSLKYEVLKKEYRPLYTWVYAKVDQAAISRS